VNRINNIKINIFGDSINNNNNNNNRNVLKCSSCNIYYDMNDNNKEYTELEWNNDKKKKG
jgi:hypothetical protein